MVNKNYKAFSLHPTQSLSRLLQWIEGTDGALVYSSSPLLDKKGKIKNGLIIAPPLESSSR